MKPGLTQTDLIAIDQDKLAELLIDGNEKREAFEAAVREIEKVLGMDADELGLEDGELVDWTADALVAHALGCWGCVMIARILEGKTL